MTSRTIIFGDIHGCLEEFMELLSLVKPRPEDHLIFVGDLIDRGPHSAEVVKLVRQLRDDHPRFDLVLGNHEETLLRWLRHRDAGEGFETKMRKNKRCATLDAQLTNEDRAFLQSAQLYVKLPDLGLLVTHAGIPPQIDVLPDDPADLQELSRKENKPYEQMCRVRFVDDDGKFISLNDVDLNQHTYWADTYDGQFGRVFFGHEPFLRSPSPKEFGYATGIDLGCCFGGRLCAVVFDGTTFACQPIWESVSIPARGAYAKFLNVLGTGKRRRIPMKNRRRCDCCDCTDGGPTRWMESVERFVCPRCIRTWPQSTICDGIAELDRILGAAKRQSTG